VTVAKPGRSQDALHQLLEERKRYEQWLATLESKRAATPEHVYNRVRSDYEQRLTAVREQLRERTGEIRSAVSGLKERLKQATEQETARVDEMHEAELRAVVGEFTPEQWELRKREVGVDLKRFADEKKKISDELNQLLLIIEQTTENGDATPFTPPATPALQTPAAPVPTFTPAAAAPAAEPPPLAPVQPDATRVRSKTPARSRAAMHSAPPSPPAQPAQPAETEKPAIGIESLAPADGLPAQVKEPAPERQRAAEPQETAAQQHAKSEARAAAHSKRSKAATFSPAQPDPRRETEKTLKCGECGAMNYPTEWYCESCGGELSAL
jgi:hypothetical protein